MGKGKCKRETQKAKFCALPGDPCKPCGNDYKQCVKQSPAWSTLAFEWVSSRGNYVGPQPPQAHHVLCASSVQKVIVADKMIDGIVQRTKWCINRRSNMKALPVWGHTVKHYCNITATGGSLSDPASVRSPWFRDLTQHDWDHNGGDTPTNYTSEVTADLKKLVKRVKSKDHDVEPVDIAGELNDRSRAWQQLLQARGKRKGGTHAAWRAGLEGDPTWCLPFSMTSTANVESKGFPVRKFDEQWRRKIEGLRRAIAGGH